MRVGLAALALVCAYNTTQVPRIDAIAFARKVTRLIVTPDLASRKGAYRLHKGCEVCATLASADLLPMHTQWAGFGVASASFKGASIGAGVGATGGHGDGARFDVGGFEGEMDHLFRLLGC